MELSCQWHKEGTRLGLHARFLRECACSTIARNKMSRDQIFALVKEHLPDQRLTGEGITLEYLIKQLEKVGINIQQYEEYEQLPASGRYEHELPEIALNILLKVSDKDLPSFCKTNKTYSSVCASNEFWRIKLNILLDYDFARIDRNYRKIYNQLKDKNTNERLIGIFRSSEIIVGSRRRYSC